MISPSRLAQAVVPLRRARGLARRPLTCAAVSWTQGDSIRCVHYDNRTRMSHIWTPEPTVQAKDVPETEEPHDKLLRAGFLRQAHSGLFHMLHFGNRVEEKLSALIERHMKAIGASRVSLSTISTEKLWRKSRRYGNVSSELFTFNDRKGSQKFLLSPTHEEEITSLVAQGRRSYKSLPFKIYQITRKYRDEFRPRQGLLRAREFLMKDLYTFDISVDDALKTYEQVRGAYDKIFADLKLPVLVAAASSGAMGGNLSHEYHLPTVLGEDHVINCNSCGYVANTEVEHSPTSKKAALAASKIQVKETKVWRGISKDKKRLINVWYPTKVIDESGKEIAYRTADINVDSIKALVPDLDTKPTTPIEEWQKTLESISNGQLQQSDEDWIKQTAPKKAQLLNLVDFRLQSTVIDELPPWKQHMLVWPYPGEKARLEESIEQHTMTTTDENGGDGGAPLDFIRARTGDLCPKCDDGTVNVTRAIELGHTFHLGTRYSEPLGATVEVDKGLALRIGALSADEAAPSVTPAKKVLSIPLQMGCYGIGVSRIIGAVADHLSDKKGLNWPRVIAPYEVAVLVRDDKDLVEVSERVYDSLAATAGPDGKNLDVLLDDRWEPMGWKVKDADLVGYPVVVVVGGAWKAKELIEVRCRRLDVLKDVSLEELPAFVGGLLENL